MTHLRETEFVDLLDGTLPPARAAHLRSCDACRVKGDEMRATVASLAHDPPGEPSPLFWEHFGAGVNRRIDQPLPAGRWWTAPRLALGALATVTLVLLTIMVLSTGGTRVTPDTAPAAASAAPARPEIDDLDADADWAIVRAAADDLDLDDAQAAGLAARPGTADRLAMELTDAERAELIRLLQAEFKSGA